EATTVRGGSQVRSIRTTAWRARMARFVLAGGAGAAAFLGLTVAGGAGTAPAGAFLASTAAASVPTPTIQGPIEPSSGISFLGSTLFSPATVGYEQSEFFLSGTATAYKNSAPLTKNGKWHVSPEATAPYTTRIVVYRPIDAAHFDGTVVVEWLNVTG